jgi:DNA polymerase
MADATICDELINALEEQRDRGVDSVWLSPANLAWLDGTVEANEARGPNPASTAALRMAALKQAGIPDRTQSIKPAAGSAPAPPAPERVAPAAVAPQQQVASTPQALEAPPSPAPEAPKPAPVVVSTPLPELGVPLPQLSAIVSECRRCGLCAERTQTVFGVGNPDADLMFIGEGPGADEDRQGEPFVGEAGKLLTKIINAGMGLRREDVYIANVVKCRPPNNRNPHEDEAAACMPYLQRQIELVAPKVIILLGAVPLRYVLGQRGITRLRGNWLDYNGIPVMPTFHPSYLLRVPAAKREVWQDVQQVMGRLGLQRPPS